MDDLFDDSRENRIEDYLFSGYRPASKSTFDIDQQFAKPIQDEDLFGIDAQNEILPDEDAIESELDTLDKNPEEFNFIKDPFECIRSEILCDKNTNSPGSIFEDEILNSSIEDVEKSDNPQSELDEIFIDDYSNSSANNINQNTSNNENNCPDKSYSRQKPPPPPPSPAQVKMRRMKEQLLEQAKAMSKGPKKLGVGFGEDGTLELNIEMHKLQSDGNSKFIFNKLFNKSKKADSPESKKRSWDAQKDSLIKKICAQKRKVWDSFQRPTPDVFDDEEEPVEIPQEEEQEAEKNVNMDEDVQHDDDDGNFEDLEREDKGSSDEEEESGDKDEIDAEDEEEVQQEYRQLDDGDEANDDDDISNENSFDEEVEDTRLSDEVISVEEDSSEEDKGFESSLKINVNEKLNVTALREESDSEDDDGCDYSLNLDEDSDDSSIRVERKRRAIFIDDEASEED